MTEAQDQIVESARHQNEYVLSGCANSGIGPTLLISVIRDKVSEDAYIYTPLISEWRLVLFCCISLLFMHVFLSGPNELVQIYGVGTNPPIRRVSKSAPRNTGSKPKVVPCRWGVEIFFCFRYNAKMCEACSLLGFKKRSWFKGPKLSVSGRSGFWRLFQ